MSLVTTKLNNCLKKVRIERGFTRQDVAEFFGYVDATIMSKWEKNAQTPNIHQLRKLATIYGTTVDALYEYDNEEEQKNMRRQWDEFVENKQRQRKGRRRVYAGAAV